MAFQGWERLYFESLGPHKSMWTTVLCPGNQKKSCRCDKHSGWALHVSLTCQAGTQGAAKGQAGVYVRQAPGVKKGRNPEEANNYPMTGQCCQRDPKY